MPNVVNPEAVDAITKSYRQIFDTALQDARPSWLLNSGLFYTIDGGLGSSMDLYWYRSYTVVRRWVGERQTNLPDEVFQYIITNGEFEGTIETKIRDIEDGQYVLKGRSQAEELAAAYQERLRVEAERLMDGMFEDTNTMDGVSLISSEHPQGTLEHDPTRSEGDQWVFEQEGTFSNEIEGNPALSEDALWQARTQMRTQKNYLGNPARLQPDLLIVGPQDERQAAQILERSYKAEENAAVDNESQGMFRYAVDNTLEGGKWLLVDSAHRKSPFIRWNRKEPQVHSTNNAGMSPQSVSSAFSGEIDAATFNHGAILHGVRGRFGFAYGAPEVLMGSDGSGS